MTVFIRRVCHTGESLYRLINKLTMSSAMKRPVSLAIQPAREPEGDVGKGDAERQADELQHHELAHTPIDVAEFPGGWPG
jgi:hypothetical protein